MEIGYLSTRSIPWGTLFFSHAWEGMVGRQLKNQVFPCGKVFVPQTVGWYKSVVNFFFWGKTARVSSISRLLFNRPVDRSRSIPTVDKDSPTWEYGRYRRSIRIHLFENTSISTVDKDSPTCKYGRYRIDRGFQQKSVEIDHRCGFIPKKNSRYRPSICPHTKKKSVDGWYRPCMYRLLDWG